MAKVGYRTAKEAVAIATKYLGYHEKASNSQLDSFTANSGSNNYTKFADELNKAGYYNGNKNGYAWCDVFFDYCIWELCDHDKKAAEAMECQTGTLGAGCTYSIQYYDNQGQLFTKPEVGDQIFFRYSGTTGSDHTGMVIAVTSSKVYTIEGNKGDAVTKCEYSLGDRTICGYGRPKYDKISATVTETPVADNVVQKQQSSAAASAAANAASSAGMVSIGKSGVKVRELHKGMSGKDCHTLMVMLQYLGLYKIYADNIFGARCDEAVRAYQKAHNLEVDGIVGVETWGSLTEKCKMLQYGSTGHACNMLMAILKDLGYYNSTIDGIFGSICKKGVMNYQASKKLEKDGIVGPITWASLLSK